MIEKKEWLQGQSNNPTQVYFWGSTFIRLHLPSHFIADKNGLLGPEKKPRAIYSKPQFFNFGVKIDSLACGDEHIAFIADGYLYTIGDNSDGRLGISKSVKSTSSPCLVESLKKYRYTSYFSKSLRSYIVKVACGARHSAALTDLGEVFTWGCGENGQLGLRNNQNQLTPQYVSLVMIDSKIRNEISPPAFDVSCGSKHTAIVTKSGDVFTFGSNEFGQLGNGNVEDEYSPVKVNLSLQKIQSVACGKHHTLVLTAQGHIFGFGLNSSGELGIGNKQSSNIPCRTLLPEENKMFKIAAGYHSAAISVKGELYIWGESALGSFMTPRKISLNTGSELASVQMGDSFTAFLDRKGHLWSYGNNHSGELGQGDLEGRNSIVQIADLGSVKIKAFCCGKNFGVALSDYPSSGLKGIKEVREIEDHKIKKSNLKQNGKRLQDQEENKEDEEDDEEEEKQNYDSSSGNVEITESDAMSSDAYQSIPKHHSRGIPESTNKLILELAGQYTSSGRIKDDQTPPLRGAGRTFETNMDTETDELIEESQTFSTQNQITGTDSKYEELWQTHEKEDRIRNILVDIKILRLQNALLEQQLEEKSQQIANFRRKMKELAATGRKNQEREQKMKELVLKLEAQSLKFREESLKNSEELMKKETEIHKLKKAIDEKNHNIEALIKDNNTLKETIHYFLELREQERDLSSKDREINHTLETRIYHLLEDLNLAPPTGYFSNTQVTETHKTETIHPREGSIDQYASLASNSPKSISVARAQAKATGDPMVKKFSENFPSRRMSSASKDMYSSNQNPDKISTAIGTHHVETSLATEEPRISTKFTLPDGRMKHLKTHTKSQCSLNLTSLISPKNGTLNTMESIQKPLISAKNKKNDVLVPFHKKKLSEPLLNFKPIPNVIEEKNHKDMVNNYFKTVNPSHEKHISASKDPRSSQSYLHNQLSTPAKDVAKKSNLTSQISPVNAQAIKDKIKPESSQLYRKLLMLHIPNKITPNTVKTGGKTTSIAGKQNLVK